MSAQGMMDYRLFRPRYSVSHVPSMLFQRNNSEVRGENKQQFVIPYALIFYGLHFCKDNLIELDVYSHRARSR